MVARHPETAQREIDTLAEQIAQYQAGALTLEEFRPRRTIYGVYGQRQKERYMVRVRIPQGRLTPEQWRALAAIAERFAPGHAHITTRQDIEFHYVHLEDVPALLRRLASVDLTTREAGGNIVRNVTCDPFTGVCPDAVFDVTPHADAVAQYFLRNPVAQDLPRKMKIAFSGCPCDHALVWVHDIGFQAVTRGGKRGFRVLVGGGLGAIPRAADVLDEFVPEEEVLPLCEAVVRVFQRTGDREHRQKARLKFVLMRIGIEAFRALVEEERHQRSSGPYPPLDLTALTETPPATRPGQPVEAVSDTTYARWCATCVRPQRQEEYAAVVVALPAGRVTAQQMRALADIAERFDVRTRASIDQNVVLRWAQVEALPALYTALREHELARPVADTPLDPVACPGAETCASAVTNGKALARALIAHLGSSPPAQADGTAQLRIRISGCPNACGHHPVGDIGLYGGALHVAGRLLPIYHLLVNDNGFGRLLARVPARRVPAAVEALIAAYHAGRQPDEPFRAFVRRVGKDELHRAIDHLLTPPAFHEEPGAYVDWEGDKLFSLDERGEGECAV